MKKIINNFGLRKITYQISDPFGTEIKDNTPPRLAAMQHTWGCSLFIWLLNPFYVYENL